MTSTQPVLQREYSLLFGERPFESMLKCHRSALNSIDPGVLDCLSYSLEHAVCIRDDADYPFLLSRVCIQERFFIAEVLESLSSIDANAFNELAEDRDVFRGALN